MAPLCRRVIPVTAARRRVSRAKCALRRVTSVQVGTTLCTPKPLVPRRRTSPRWAPLFAHQNLWFRDAARLRWHPGPKFATIVVTNEGTGTNRDRSNDLPSNAIDDSMTTWTYMADSDPDMLTITLGLGSEKALGGIRIVSARDPSFLDDWPLRVRFKKADGTMIQGLTASGWVALITLWFRRPPLLIGMSTPILHLPRMVPLQPARRSILRGR